MNEERAQPSDNALNPAHSRVTRLAGQAAHRRARALPRAFGGRRQMKTFRKRDFPLSEIRRYLEPGPIVLVSSSWKGKTNIMTMGWHMMLQFSPALFGCYIWDGNHSFEMIRRSKECVINVPTTDLRRCPAFR